MRIRRLIFIGSISTIIILLCVITLRYILKETIVNTHLPKILYNDKAIVKNKTTEKHRIFYVAVVACGQRLQETLMMVKSALLFNHFPDKLHFLIFAENQLSNAFIEKLNDWRILRPNEFDFELLPLQFPPNREKEWRTLFKPCAAQRLFLPSLLKAIEALLYVDTDILFLSAVSDIWNFFHEFNSSQIAALTPEHEDGNIGWYNRFARHPYYGKLGVNSGVMLMNLTRMRQFGWEARVLPIHNEYKLLITWGDQDIINILFYYHPDKLYVMPCEYNYRPDHCMYMNICNITNVGIKIIHGNRGYFHSNKQPLFRVIYEAVENYKLNADPYRYFLQPLQTALNNPTIIGTNCGKISSDVLLLAKRIFRNHYAYNI